MFSAPKLHYTLIPQLSRASISVCRGSVAKCPAKILNKTMMCVHISVCICVNVCVFLLQRLEFCRLNNTCVCVCMCVYICFFLCLYVCKFKSVWPFISPLLQLPAYRPNRAAGGWAAAVYFQPKVMFPAGENSVNNEERLLFVLPVKAWPTECDNIFTSLKHLRPSSWGREREIGGDYQLLMFKAFPEVVFLFWRECIIYFLVKPRPINPASTIASIVSDFPQREHAALLKIQSAMAALHSGLFFCSCGCSKLVSVLLRWWIPPWIIAEHWYKTAVVETIQIEIGNRLKKNRLGQVKLSKYFE